MTRTLIFFNDFLPQVLKSAPDVSTQYMPIMNCIFAAQKSVRVLHVSYMEAKNVCVVSS